MKKKTLIILIGITLTILVAATIILLPKTPKERFEGNDYGIDLFSKIDYLAKQQNQTISEQQTSYSRDGGNDDGFGLPRNVNGEPNNEANPLRRVLLDVKQPGVVYRMWFTNWGTAPDLRIYVDGNEVIRENLVDLSSGNIKPFVKPLVATKEESSGGYVFYVPIVFKESILIIGSGEFYYNINYQKLPADADVEPFSLDLDVSKAVDILNNVTKDPKFTGDYKHKDGSSQLMPNLETTIYENNSRSQVSAINFNIKDLTAETLDRTIINDSTFTISRNDELTFKLNVTSGEQLLTMRTIIQSNAQEVDVFVDDTHIGRARVRPRRLDGFEWKDNPYLYDVEMPIPIANTQGKSEVTIKLVGVSDFLLSAAWTGLRDAKIDEVLFSNETSRENHNTNFTGRYNFVPFENEYDPNTLISLSDWERIYANEDIVNNIWINVYYDNKTVADIKAPLSAFFGFGAFGMFETKSLMNGLLADGTMYSYYPMPYEESIKITVENKNATRIDNLDYKISYEENIYEKDSYGYFKTNYVVNEAGTDTALKDGVPITFLETTGSGHVVGVTHSMTGDYFGEHSRFYLEGDEQIYIDGQLSHSFHGTGTEDFYNGGWYFNNGVQVHPLYGQSTHNYRNNTNRTVMNRTLVVDPIVFRSGINFKMEHGGWNSRPDSNVYLAVHYYHNEEVATELTDTFNFTNESYKTKDYSTDNLSSFNLEFNNGSYEGYFSHIVTDKTVKSEVNTYSTFTVNINENNNGILLRVLQDLNIIEQEAKIYVDGNLVGIWNNPFRAAVGGYVRTIEYVIPKSYTQGKSSITIRVENNSENKTETPWTELEYNIYSIK